MQWKKLLFGTVACLAAIVAGGLIGGLLGRYAAEGQMMAGGAIVAFYMLVGAVLGGAFAGFLTYRWPQRKIGWLALSMLVLAGIASLILFAQIKEREARRAEMPPTSLVTEPVPTLPATKPEAPQPEDTLRWIDQETSPPVMELNMGPSQCHDGGGFRIWIRWLASLETRRGFACWVGLSALMRLLICT